MLFLKCTADVQKLLGLTRQNLMEPQPSDAPLGHWYVNRFNLGRRKALAFMSEATLLSFILFQGGKPVTPARLPDMFLAGLAQLLQMRGLPTDAVSRALQSYHTGFFAKTDSRAALGSLNDIIARYQWSVKLDGGLERCNLTGIIMQINEAPQRRLDWASSWDATESRLRLLS